MPEYTQTAVACDEHPDCIAITGPGWVSHASDELHVACRIAPGTTAVTDGDPVEGRDGICEACCDLLGA